MKVFCMFFLAVIIGFSSCKKAAYLTDDGLHVAEVNMSTYDYLAAHPYKMFDTLLLVIDHFNLKEEINKATTFWAPSDFSVLRHFNVKKDSVTSADENAVYTFTDFLNNMSVDSVRSYIYNDGQHGLDKAKTEYTTIENKSGIGGFAFHKQRQPQGQWSFQDVYHLYYLKVRGQPDAVGPDGSVRIDRNDLADTRILCQTTGIKTNTGTIINVLANTHTFITDFSHVINNGPRVDDLPDGIRFTYAVSFKAANAYTGTSVVASSAWIAETFGLTADEIPSLMGSSIIFYAIEANGALNSTYTANAPGHWFDGNGNVINWGASARLFSEYNASAFTFNIGQYPNTLGVGDKYTIRQAMVYTNRNNQKIKAEFYFNITIN